LVKIFYHRHLEITSIVSTSPFPKATPHLSPAGGALKRLASIHPVADKAGSRKPLFTSADPYALGPGLRGVFAIDRRIRADILLHVWIDIHSSL
jgi:hypothetical protein